MKTEAGHLRPYKLKDDTTERQAERQRAVADPDLQIKEGGGGGAVSKKIFFSPSGLIWSKNKEGLRAPPLDSPMKGTTT